MPNPTVRASAEALPKDQPASLTRRAALSGALAAIPALAGAAIAATPSLASAANPDEELIALRAAIDAADHRVNAAFEVLGPAENAYFAILPPKPAEPTIVRDVQSEEWFKALQKKMEDDKVRGPAPELKAYGDAMQAWQEDRARLHDECGVTAAENDKDAAEDEVLALRDMLVANRATTLAGIKFKTKYAAAHYKGEYDTEVMTAIVDDLLAL